MAGVTVAELTAKLIMDTRDFVAGAKAAEGAVQSFEDRLKKMGDSMTAAGKKMSVTVTAPIVAAFGFATHALMEHEKHQVLVQAHIKSTGGIAGVSAEHIDSMTASLAKMSGASKGSVSDGQAMLLTFTQIRDEAGKGNDIFDQTTKAVLDMSTAMGRDMTDVALQVGKAMQNPVEGVTALQRAGVRLTEQQKQQVAEFVRVGDTVSAQKMILKELNTEFGGTAEMMGKTMVGDMGRMQQSFRDAGTSMATVFAPVVVDITHGITDLMNFIAGSSPTVRLFAVGFLAVVASIGPALVIIGKMATGVAALEGMMAKRAARAAASAAADTAAASAASALAEATTVLADAQAAAAAAAGVEAEAETMVADVIAAGGAITGEALAATEALTVAKAELAAADGELAAAEAAQAAAQAASSVASEGAAGILAGTAASGGLLLPILGGLAVAGGLLAGAMILFRDKGKSAKEEVAAFSQSTTGATAATIATVKALADLGPALSNVKNTQAEVNTVMVAGTLEAARMNVANGRVADDTKTIAKGHDILTEALKEGNYAAANRLVAMVKGTSVEKQWSDEVQHTIDAQVQANADQKESSKIIADATPVLRDLGAAAESSATDTLKLADANLAAKQSSAQLVSTLWGIVDAQRAVKATNLEVAATTIANNQASAASASAADAVTKAKRAEADARLEVSRAAVEEEYAETNANNAVIASVLGLQKAYSDLAYAQVQLDRAPAMQARREVDAANDVVKALINQRKATDDLAAARLALARLPTTYAREVADAADKLSSAYINQAKAINDVTLAQQAYNQVTSAGHAAALADAVTTATINQTRAHDGVTIAQRKSTEAGAALTKTQKEIKDVLAGNTTHLSDFAKTIQGTFATALDATQRFKADTAISLGGLTATLEANLKDFASWQDNLAKIAAGGHADLAKNLAAMGPSAAYAVAQAVDASGPELDKLQDLYKQKTTFEAPKFAVGQAKKMGDSGVDTEYLAGLKKQEKDQADAKKQAAQDVTLAQIAARAADEGVNKALQDQANLFIEISSAAGAVQAAIIGTHTAANGVVDALQAQADLLTGPNSLAAQQQKLTDAVTLANIAVGDSANAVTDALNKQSDVLAKIGPYEDAAVQASQAYWAAQAALDTVSQGLTHSLQAQSDLMNKVGPNLDPVTAANQHLADAITAVNNAMLGSQAAANAYLKGLATTQSPTEIASQNNAKLASDLAAGQAQVVGLAEAQVPDILTMHHITPASATDLQHLQAKVIALQTILASGQIPKDSPLYGVLTGYLATLQHGIKPDAVQLPPMAMGGRAAKGLAYLVGEKRPEVFVPDRDGRVVPSVGDFMRQTKPYSPPVGQPVGTAGGDTHYHVAVTVQGQVMTDRDLVHSIHRGLLEKQRQGGNLGFEGA